MKPEILSKIKAEAFDEGLNDTTTDQVLFEAARAFIDSNVTEELTDDEQTEITESYIAGFKSGL